VSTVILVRACETAWHEQGKLVGRRDLGLSAPGKTRARALLDVLASLEMTDLLSSPLTRATETAAVLAEKLGIGVGRDPRLLEIDLGPLEGKSAAELASERGYAEFVSGRRDRPPGGEPLEEVRERMLASLEHALADNPADSCIVVVSHDVAIRVLLAHFLGLEPGGFARLRVDPGSCSVLRHSVEQRTCSVECINWSPALPIGRPR
jgi:broad specificity phosphatase PhoE